MEYVKVRRGRQPRTPEQLARAATERRPSPPGRPDRVVVNVRLVLPRPLVEQLVARAIRQGVRLEVVVEELLEAGGTS